MTPGPRLVACCSYRRHPVPRQPQRKGAPFPCLRLELASDISHAIVINSIVSKNNVQTKICIFCFKNYLQKRNNHKKIQTFLTTLHYQQINLMMKYYYSFHSKNIMYFDYNFYFSKYILPMI